MESTETTLAVILEKLENMDEKIDRIEGQTTKTNGRVNALEHWQTKIKTIFSVALFIGALVGMIVDKLMDIILK